MTTQKPIPLPRETGIFVGSDNAPKDAIISRQRKQLLLNFIHEYYRVKGYYPKFVEMAKGIGFSETSEGTVYTLAMQLVDEGWLTSVPGVARTTIPAYPASAVYCEITRADLKLVAKKQKNLRILRRL